MTYNNNIPQSGQNLGQTRAQINTNFSLINSVEAVNHVAFNLAGAGKHKFLQMPDQPALPTPPPTTLVNESGFYSKAVIGISQLFFRGENNGSEYQLTVGSSGVDANIATFATNAPPYSAGPPSLSGGWTFLPGGLLLQYGTVTSANGGAQTAILFPRAFNAASIPFSITTTMIRTSGSADVIYVVPGSPTDIDFDVFNTSASLREFYWMAIGIA